MRIVSCADSCQRTRNSFQFNCIKLLRGLRECVVGNVYINVKITKFVKTSLKLVLN